MRCPSCEKFVSLEMADEPEVNLDVEYDAEAKQALVSGTVRIVRNCAECSDEMKEATFDVEMQIDVELPDGADVNNVNVEEESVENVEEGGGRYAKSYFGASMDVVVKLEDKEIGREHWTDKIQASAMDELV